MANYMAEVAKLLGVEIGEEFRTDKHIGPFMLTDIGIVTEDEAPRKDSLLRKLLTGEQKVIKYKDIPSYGSQFWYIAKNGNIYTELWEGTTFNFVLNKIGNCYKTKRDAEANRDKWSRFYASDEVLEI